MFKIIGSDGNEYGPVTSAEVRQWIEEGRLNGKSLAKSEHDAEFRPLATFPEFADTFASQPASGATTSPNITPPFGSGSLSDDYELDLVKCITSAWNLIKTNMGPVIGISALVLLTLFAINQLFGLITHPILDEMISSRKVSPHGIVLLIGVSIVSAPISTILMAGLFKYYLKLIRGELTGIGDAFAGFGPSTGQLILLGLVQMVLVMVGYLFCVIPGIYLAVAWYFAVPLVIDRGLDFWKAMELSRRRVSKHWFLAFAAMIVFSLIAVAGILLCGVGMLVTIPLGTIALMYAYETIFGAEAN